MTSHIQQIKHANQQPDATKLEKKIAEECAKYRAAQRFEYQKIMSNPHRNPEDGGLIFDKGIQRYMSTKAKEFDYFKPTPKTTAYGVCMLILPIMGLIWVFRTERGGRERLYRTGQVSYRNRDFKFV